MIEGIVMEKNFNKLFDINYKQKIITVFYDEFNRKTFLEKKNDKYDYLEYEDYVFLHNLFNASPFIRPIFEKFKYEEKVKLTSALLAVQILITGMLGCGCNVSLGNNAVLVTSSNTLTYYDHMDDLKKELGVVSPSNAEVYNSIDNNGNLPDNFKEIAHKIVDVLSSYNFDLTVFNLNIKDLTVDLKGLEEIKQYKENVVAYYDTSLNKIIASPDASESVITHELMHATNNFYRVTIKIICWVFH